MRVRVTAALASLLALSACLPHELTGPEAVQATLFVRADLAGTLVATVVVEVTAPDIATPLALNVPIANGVAAGTITVPAGSQRSIALRAYDAGGIETDSGAVTVNIQPGTNPTLSIVLMPLTGTVPITVTLGSFTVTIAPAVATLEPGDTVHLAATILDASGNPIAAQVTWATLAPSVATVASTGQLTGCLTAVGAGQAGVVASYRGVAGAATITVAAVP